MTRSSPAPTIVRYEGVFRYVALATVTSAAFGCASSSQLPPQDSPPPQATVVVEAPDAALDPLPDAEAPTAEPQDPNESPPGWSADPRDVDPTSARDGLIAVLSSLGVTFQPRPENPAKSCPCGAIRDVGRAATAICNKTSEADQRCRKARIVEMDVAHASAICDCMDPVAIPLP